MKTTLDVPSLPPSNLITTGPVLGGSTGKSKGGTALAGPISHTTLWTGQQKTGISALRFDLPDNHPIGGNIERRINPTEFTFGLNVTWWRLSICPPGGHSPLQLR